MVPPKIDKFAMAAMAYTMYNIIDQRTRWKHDFPFKNEAHTKRSPPRLPRWEKNALVRVSFVLQTIEPND
jgi:hypothetical protein